MRTRLFRKLLSIREKWQQAQIYWSLRKLGFSPADAKSIRTILLKQAWKDL